MGGDKGVTWMTSKPAAALTLVLLLEAPLFYTASRAEHVPASLPLESFPAQIQDWRLLQDYPVEPEIRDQLKADDMLNRYYAERGSSTDLNLFVAYFKTQRTGQAPHSPKNCLPGSGWEPEATGYLDVAVAGRRRPIRINRYVVAHGDQTSVVLYWYQSRRRVIASEFAAKFWLVLDSIRYHRSDTALVRVTIPVVHNDAASATRLGAAFVARVFPVLHSYLPA